MSDIQILINKMLRSFWIGIIKPLMNLLSSIVDAFFNGVLGFADVALNSSFIQEAYKAAFALFFLILGVKIAYEIFSKMMEGEEVDYEKKILGAIKGTIIAAALPILVVTIANPLATNCIKTIAGGNSDYFSEEICVSIFTSFGNMPEYDDLFVDQRDDDGNVTLGMDLGARQFVHLLFNEDDALKGIYADPNPSYDNYDEYYRTTNSFRTEQRWGLYHWWDASDNSSWFGVNSDDGDLYGDFDSGEENLGITEDREILAKRKSRIENNEYEMVWQFGELMVILGLIVTIFLLFIIALEMTSRSFMIAFGFASGPLCCLTLTNIQRGGQEPQGFNIWKQTLIGNWIVNFGQMFSFVFFLRMITEIRTYLNNLSLSDSTKAICMIILFWGALSFVVSIPPYLKGLLGGYGASVSETAQAIKGAISSAGMATGASAAKALTRVPETVLGRRGVNERTDSLRRRAGRKIFGIAAHPKKTYDRSKEKINNGKDKINNAKDKINDFLSDNDERSAKTDDRARKPLGETDRSNDANSKKGGKSREKMKNSNSKGPSSNNKDASKDSSSLKNTQKNPGTNPNHQSKNQSKPKQSRIKKQLRNSRFTKSKKMRQSDRRKKK